VVWDAEAAIAQFLGFGGRGQSFRAPWPHRAVSIWLGRAY